ncbi:SAM-dependent methyltransferase, partial [Acinetobacter baumannii]
YATRPADEVSWYQPSPAPSLAAIGRTGLGPTAAVSDVGGGASILAGELYERGFRDVTVLDIAEAGLAVARERMGTNAQTVAWIVAD